MAQALPFLLVAGAAAKIYGGVQANNTAKMQAAQAEEQARIASAEAEREANRQTEQQRKFVAQQKMAFLANGVGLDGTPALVLEDTFQQFQQEINAVRRSGAAKANFLNTEANISRSSGRASLVSGVLEGVSSLGSGYIMGKSGDIF